MDYFGYKNIRKLALSTVGAVFLIFAALVLSGSITIPGLKLALNKFDGAQAAAVAYWTTIPNWTSYGGYPSPLQAPGLVYLQAPYYASYGCSASYCFQNQFCVNPYVGVLSALGNTGVAGRVYSNGTQDQSGTAIVPPGGSVQLDWACQPYVSIHRVDGSQNYCPDGGTVYNYYATNLTVTGPGVSTSSTMLTGGTITFNPPGSAGTIDNYTLTCKGSGAQTWAATVPVYITSATMSLQACDPNGQNCSTNKTIASGGKSLLQWNVTNANSCILNGPNGAVGSVGLGSDASGNANLWTLNNIDASDQVADSPTNSFATLNQLFYFPQTYSKGTVQEAGLAANGGQEANANVQLTSGKWYWEYTPLNAAASGGFPVGGVARDTTSGFDYRQYAGQRNDTGIGWGSDGSLYNDVYNINPIGLPQYFAGDTIGVAYDADSGKVYFSRNGVWLSGDNLIPNMLTNPLGGITMSGSNEYQPARYAADRTANTGWSSYNGTAGYPINNPQWLKVDFGSGNTKTVRSYSIRNYYGDTGYAPTNFQLQGTNDTTNTTWTTLDTRSGLSWLFPGDTKYFTVASPASYRYYRVYITATSNNHEAIIAELGLYPEATPNPADGTSYAGVVESGYPSLASPQGKTLINFGQGGGPQSRLGGAGFFSGATNAFDTTPYASEFNFSGDYTIDLWAYPTTQNNGGLLSRNSSSGYSPYLILQNGSSIDFYSAGQSNSWTIASAQHICNGNVAPNVWYHLAVVRSGNNYYAFCNGVRTSQWVSSIAPWASTDDLSIGRQYQSGVYFTGFIDELRISNKARWVTNFSPSASAYSSDANTVLLMHFDGTLADASTYAHMVSPYLYNGAIASTYDAASGGTFAYTPPAGYKAIATGNWPTPATAQPNLYVDAKAYSGTGGFQTVSANFQPDLVWIKNRTAAFWNTLSDSARGTDNDLFSNSTSAATTDDPNGWVSALSAQGFTVGGTCSAIPNNTNAAGNSYIAWAWKRLPAAGVDIVSYQGDGTPERAVGHGLGTAPDTIIVKRSDSASDWYVWSSSLASGDFLKLDTTDSATAANSPFGVDLIPTMTGATTNGVTMSASTQYSSVTLAWNAGDKNTSTAWQAVNNTSGYPNVGNPQWLQVDLGTGKTVGAYTITTYNASNIYQNTPASFVLQGSNDASTWTPLDTQQNAPWVGYSATKLNFAIAPANQASYRYYRVYITRTSSLEPIISELNLWQAPTVNASSFTVADNNYNTLNASGASYTAYLFSNREGLQKSGVYYGNGTADGPFVYTGFKPKFVMVKDVSDTNGQWVTWDGARDTSNPLDAELFPNTSSVESAGGTDIDALANGFKIRRSATNFNANQIKFVYIAFADVPFKQSAGSANLSIANSLRFDSTLGAYLTRTLGTATNRSKFTFSGWIKRGTLGSSQAFFSGPVQSYENAFYFDSSDRLVVQLSLTGQGGSYLQLVSNAVYRDPARWMHIVVAVDTTQASASNRVRVYVDGSEITSWSTDTRSTLSQNNNTLGINSAGAHQIGRSSSSGTYYFDGEESDLYFIDGQQLTPSYFGQSDGSGYWRPKSYSGNGTYGANGFHLDFSNANTLGADSTGLNNNWASNNIVAVDQVTDTPTNNYSVLNNIYYFSPTYGKGVQAGGLATNGGHQGVASFQPTSGKWYWEYYPFTGASGNYPVGGVAKDTSSGYAFRAFAGQNNDSGYGYQSNGIITTNTYSTTPVVSSYRNGDVIGVAYDADSGKVYVSRNGTWQNGVNLIPQMYAATTNGVTISQSNYYTTGYEGWRAADRNSNNDSNGTNWYTSGHVPTVASPDWLRTDFGVATTVGSYSIKIYYGGVNTYDPINFTLEGSNDATTCTISSGGTVWTVLDTQTNVLWEITNEQKVFPLSSSANYRCYRLKVTAAGSIPSPTNYLSINEFGLYGAGQSGADPTAGTGYVGVIQGGAPSLDSNSGKARINFGQGGAGDTFFRDSSSYAHPISLSDSVAPTSTPAKFGNSAYFNGSSYAFTPDAPEFNITGDYTIDLWAYPTTLGGGGVFSRDTNGYSGYVPYMVYQNGSSFTFYSAGQSNSWTIASAQNICTGVVTNQWYHLAVVRSGNTYSTYCNGVRTTTWTSAVVPWTTSQAPLIIGRQYNSSAYFTGYVDEVRLSNIARWSGTSFAVPSAAYTADSNTVFLAHLDNEKSAFYQSAAGGYFVYTPPTGYKALSTSNLPAATINTPSTYVDAKAYIGTSGNPSFDQVNKGSNITLNNNFEDVTSGTNSDSNNNTFSTNTFSTGKWYAEFKRSANYVFYFGISDASKRVSTYIGNAATDYAWEPYGGNRYTNNVSQGSLGTASANDVLMIAVDMDNKKVWFGKNGTWYGGGNPATGANPQYSNITAGTYAFALTPYASNGVVQAMFGQPGRLGTTNYASQGGYFYYQPPAGFSGLAAGSDSQNVALGFKPDLVWIKNRLTTNWQTLVDSSRGAAFNLYSNSTGAQTQNDINGTVTSFNAAGFTVGATCSAGSSNVNAVGNNYVSWLWKKSPTSGFDVVSWSGTGTSSQTILHSLGTTPDLIIGKRVDAADHWYVWSSALGLGDFLTLNSTNARSESSSPFTDDLIPTMTAATTNGVTMSGSKEYNGNYAWRAGDKNLTNYWQSYAGSNLGYPNYGYPQWLTVDLGSAKKVGGYTITAYNLDNYTYAPVDFQLQGTNDTTNTTWTTLDTRSAVSWIGYGERRTFTIAAGNQANYRYYRLYITRTTSGEVIIEELNLWDAPNPSTSGFTVTSNNGGHGLNDVPLGGDQIPTMTAATTNGVTMSGSTEYYAAYNAGDKNASSYWYSYPNAPSVGTPQWIKTDFGAGNTRTIAAYTVQNSSSNIPNAPVDWQLQGSNDATTCSSSGTLWTILDARSYVYWIDNGEAKTFFVAQANQAAYRCYRLSITRTQGGTNPVIIAEVNLWAAGSGSSQYVAYLFSNREGLQKTGIYYGNGSSDGPFVYTGFKPKFVMIKEVASGNSNTNWAIYDSAREPQNPLYKWLYPNQAYQEGNTDNYCNSANCPVDFLVDGFKLRNPGYWPTNTNQKTYLYLAFADVPYKYSAAPGAISIPNSLRFDSASNGYLARTFPTAGNQQKFTISMWVKRAIVSDLTQNRDLFSSKNSSGSSGAELFFGAGLATGSTYSPGCSSPAGGDVLEFGNYQYSGSACTTDGITYYPGLSSQWSVKTSGLYRDPGAWMQVVVAVDTTQFTAANRAHIYVNGAEVPYDTTNSVYPSQNATIDIDAALEHDIGRSVLMGASSNPGYFDGNIADLYFVDGQQLAPSNFGAYDTYGYWRPAAYTGTYGTNGFHLDFSSAQSTDFSTGSGTFLVGPLYSNTTYTLMCVPVEGGTLSTAANITVSNTALAITACRTDGSHCSVGATTPAALSSIGDSASVSWTALGMDTNSCNVTYPGGSLNPASTNNASNVTTPAITTPTTYTLTCNQTTSSNLGTIDATFYNSPAVVAGKINNAIKLVNDNTNTNSTDQYGEIPNNTTFQNLQNGSYSISVWFYPSNLPPGDPMTSANDSTYGVVIKTGYHEGLIYDHNGNFGMTHYLAGDVWKGSGWGGVYPPGQWYHLVGVVDNAAGSIKLYVNGVVDDAAGDTDNTFTPGTAGRDYGTATWKIGIASPQNNQYRWAANGTIDDVQLFGRALSAQDVATLYGQGSVTSGFLGRWTLDNLSGQTATGNSSITTSVTANTAVTFANACATGVGVAANTCSNQCQLYTSTLTPGSNGATLSWCCPSGSANISNYPNGFGGSLPGSGSGTVAPTSPTTYGLSCASGQASVTLTPSNAGINLLNVSPTRVRKGGTVYATWDTFGMNSCALYDDTGYTHQVGSGLTSSGTATPVTINGATTLTLICTDGVNNYSGSANVGLLPGFKEL